MTVDWQQRPIDHWPGELTKTRVDAPFKSGWRSTTELLDRELRMARRQSRRHARRARTQRLPHRRPATRQRASAASRRHPHVREPIRAAPLRSCENPRYCSPLFVIPYRSTLRSASRPPGTVMGAQMSKSEAARVLLDLADPDGVTGTSPVDLLTGNGEVDEMFKIAARAHHPDRPGGNADLFRRANEARDVLQGANT